MHLVVIAHLVPALKEGDDSAGILPSVKGQLKVDLPALIDDWILLEHAVGQTPERRFVVGAQGTRWNHHGRNIKRSCVIEANFTTLLGELGLEP
jgi:hypothetical protein